MMRRQSEGVCNNRQICVISVDIRPPIGVFSLYGHAQPVSGGEKGASAEGDNINILRENIDISGEISIRIDIFAITTFGQDSVLRWSMKICCIKELFIVVPIRVSLLKLVFHFCLTFSFGDLIYTGHMTWAMRA